MNAMRIYGFPLTAINCRLLIAELLAAETPEALNLAERISNVLTRNEAVAPLVPGERDTLLRNLPKKPPNGLVALRDALKKDQSARK